MTGSPSAGSGFGRLRVKLFLAIAGANALLAAVAYLVFSASFDRGLAETLGRGDQARLEAFAAPSPRATGASAAGRGSPTIATAGRSSRARRSACRAARPAGTPQPAARRSPPAARASCR